MKHFSLSKAVFMAASLALLGLTAANAQEKFSPVIVIHGGTSGLDLTKEEFKIREEPMKKALLAGQAVLEKGGSAIIFADHGNSETMVTPEGTPHTAHTTVPVPVIVTKKGVTLREGGRLADVAPTMLDLLGLEKPAEMDGTTLIVK